MNTINRIGVFLLIMLAVVMEIPSAFALDNDSMEDTSPIYHWRVPDIAVMNTGFVTEDISVERQKSIQKSTGLHLIKTDPEKSVIICLDVREDHTIAVGYDGPLDNDAIGVYSQDGVFQYGYALDGDGNFCVEWKEENLLIYIEGAYFMEITPSGKIVSVKEIIESRENRSYWYDVKAKGRMVGDTLYRIQNDKGFFLNLVSPCCSQVVSVAPNGETTVILDYKVEHFKKDMLHIAFMVFVMIVFVMKVFKWDKKILHLLQKIFIYFDKIT